MISEPLHLALTAVVIQLPSATKQQHSVIKGLYRHNLIVLFI